MVNNVIHWLPAVFYGITIFWVSHQSNPVGAGWMPDYAGHFLEYGLFALTLVWGVTSGRRKQLSRGGIMLVWTVSILYALSDEFHQSFVPNRDMSLADLGVDILGATVFLLTMCLANGGKWRK